MNDFKKKWMQKNDKGSKAKLYSLFSISLDKILKCYTTGVYTVCTLEIILLKFIKFANKFIREYLAVITQFWV